MPKILYDYMPVIHFKPEKVVNMHDQGDYNCPMYKTSARRGVLSTTGTSWAAQSWLVIVDTELY